MLTYWLLKMLSDLMLSLTESKGHLLSEMH